MGLLDRIAAGMTSRDLVPRNESRFAVDQWLANYLLPANEFGYNNHTYPFGLNQTLVADRAREISTTLPGYLGALRMCPPAFASQMFRAMVLSQARFTFRNNRLSRTPGRLFGSQALIPLERPWRNATTGELLARMEWHAGLAGNAYVTNRPIRDRGTTTDRLRVLRPDWVVIVYGSEQEPEDAAFALDGEVIGYAYCNGGIALGRNKTTTLLPGDVSHWSPLPDPECAGIGMSWITPAVREIQGDRAATDHKLQFFNNAGTPNMVVKGLTAASKEAFEELVDMMETRHAGVRNAYRTLYLTAGADATVVGSNLQQMDFKNTQGAGETRITQLSRVHPVLLGASEGLQGSSLNAGNFGAARRMFADSWLYPMLQDVAAALAPLIKVPSDAELWTTTSDMPILREDAKDAAEIEQIKASTINGHITAGFTPESAVAAVDGQDVKLLVHTGLISVQLQPPGAPPPTAGPASTGDTPKPKPGPGGAGPKGPEGREFDPDQLRDPRTGKWIDDPLSTEQANALLPKRGGWTTTTRAGVVGVLKKTPEGQSLLKTVDSFQSGSSVAIPRLRTDIEKVLTGDTSLAPGRVDSVRTLLGAIAQSDAGDRPLYRGMIAPETVDEVLARYKTGDALDLSLASFSSDKKLAAEFSIKGAGQRVTGKKVRTPVFIEWLTGPKHALPVENLSKSRVFSNEKEWIGAGRYKIVKAFSRTRLGVTTVVLQVEQVDTW